MLKLYLENCKKNNFKSYTRDSILGFYFTAPPHWHLNKHFLWGKVGLWPSKWASDGVSVRQIFLYLSQKVILGQDRNAPKKFIRTSPVGRGGLGPTLKHLCCDEVFRCIIFYSSTAMYPNKQASLEKGLSSQGKNNKINLIKSGQKVQTTPFSPFLTEKLMELQMIL